ncbi:TspO/MBR family protein [Nocardia sp. NPDC055321]
MNREPLRIVDDTRAATAHRSPLIDTTARVAAAAVAGSIATDPDSSWYKSLRMPRFQPPRQVFPLAWSLVYADIALSTAAALDRESGSDERSALMRALEINLAVNAAWSWLFFRAHRPGAAALTSAVLTASGVDLVRRVGRARPAAGAALAAYPAWCGFATVLSTAIWRRNR